jgi:peptidoglycan/LPS O-acetylase OafA/YrhL
LEVLDGLRFMAALAVVLYHFTTMDRVWLRRADQIFPDQTAAYGWLGVHLFFLISGFVICMSAWDRGVGSFLRSRAVRLYPAYWLSVLVVGAVAYLWPVLHGPAGWEGTLVNLTMFQDAVGVPPVAEVYWTLWAELRFYLLFAVLVWWGLTYRRVAGFCLVWLAAVTVTKAFVPDGGIVHIVLMTDYAPLFTGGIGFYLMYRFGPTILSGAIVAASFVLSVPAVRYRNSLEAYLDKPAPPVWLAVALLAVCFLLIAAVALGWLSWLRGRWLVVLGATTYPLYLLHFDVGGTVLNLWQWTVPPPVLVTVVTVGMVGVAWLVHRYVERPVSALLKRALTRNPAPAQVAARYTQESMPEASVTSTRR